MDVVGVSVYVKQILPYYVSFALIGTGMLMGYEGACSFDLHRFSEG